MITNTVDAEGDVREFALNGKTVKALKVTIGSAAKLRAFVGPSRVKSECVVGQKDCCLKIFQGGWVSAPRGSWIVKFGIERFHVFNAWEFEEYFAEPVWAAKPTSKLLALLKLRATQENLSAVRRDVTELAEQKGHHSNRLADTIAAPGSIQKSMDSSMLRYNVEADAKALGIFVNDLRKVEEIVAQAVSALRD